MEKVTFGFTKTFQGFTANQCRKNLWRFKRFGYEFNDLYNECFLTFLRCNMKFKGETEKEFQALYSRSISNSFVDMLKDLGSEKDLDISFQEYVEESKYEGTSTRVVNTEEYQAQFLSPEKAVEFKMRLEKAPSEVKQFLHLVYNTPKEFTDMVCKHSKGLLSNERVCKFLGLEKVNVLQMTKDFLLNSL